jgi:hypothetical protein
MDVFGQTKRYEQAVASFTGAWIETVKHTLASDDPCRLLHGGVDRNRKAHSRIRRSMSPPSRGRGSKPVHGYDRQIGERDEGEDRDRLEFARIDEHSVAGELRNADHGCHGGELEQPDILVSWSLFPCMAGYAVRPTRPMRSSASSRSASGQLRDRRRCLSSWRDAGFLDGRPWVRYVRWSQERTFMSGRGKASKRPSAAFERQFTVVFE